MRDPESIRALYARNRHSSGAAQFAEMLTQAVVALPPEVTLYFSVWTACFAHQHDARVGDRSVEVLVDLEIDSAVVSLKLMRGRESICRQVRVALEEAPKTIEGYVAEMLKVREQRGATIKFEFEL